MPISIQVDYNNPLAPATAPTAEEMLNAYSQHGAMIRGESSTATSGDGYNPYKVTQPSQQDAQQQHISDMEQFISPIKMNKDDGKLSDEHYKRFEHHVTNDPAVKEVEPLLMDHLSTLKAGIDSGRISLDQAHSIFLDYGHSVLDPIIDKHHGKHSDTHNSSLFDEIPTDTPDIVKRAKAKGAK